MLQEESQESSQMVNSGETDICPSSRTMVPRGDGRARSSQAHSHVPVTQVHGTCISGGWSRRQDQAY